MRSSLAGILTSIAFVNGFVVPPRALDARVINISGKGNLTKATPDLPIPSRDAVDLLVVRRSAIAPIVVVETEVDSVTEYFTHYVTTTLAPSQTLGFSLTGSSTTTSSQISQPPVSLPSSLGTLTIGTALHSSVPGDSSALTTPRTLVSSLTDDSSTAETGIHASIPSHVNTASGPEPTEPLTSVQSTSTTTLLPIALPSLHGSQVASIPVQSHPVIAGPGGLPPPVKPPPGGLLPVKPPPGALSPPVKPPPDPTRPPQPSASQTSGCTDERTAKLCTAFKTFEVNKQGSTLSSSTSEKCRTTVGCSVEASTTTQATTCTVVTASICSTTTVCPTDSPSGACSTSSRCTATATGCSVKSTSTSTMVPSRQMIVWPRRNKDVAAAKLIREKLARFVEPDGIYESSSNFFGIFFWRVTITPAQVDELRQTPGVASVTTPCRGACVDPTLDDSASEELTGDSTTSVLSDYRLEARDLGLIRQKPVENALKFFSQAPGNQLDDLKDRYVYDRSGGEGQTVYIVDYGLALNNPEFDDIRSKTHVLYANDDPKHRQNPVSNHGTAMTSKISGKRFGVSKNANIRFVTLGPNSDPGDWLDGIKVAVEDYRDVWRHAPGQQGKGAVLLMALAFIEEEVPDQKWIDDLRILLRAGAAAGMFPITGSGKRGGFAIASYPQLFAAGLTPDVPDLLVVGGVTATGAPYLRAQRGPFVEVTAPADAMDCASKDGGDGTTSGTSPASASVAGLAAYFMGLTSITNRMSTDPRTRNMQIKAHIITQAWRRPETVLEDPPSVWNGVHSENFHQQCIVQKRGVDPPPAVASSLPIPVSTLFVTSIQTLAPITSTLPAATSVVVVTATAVPSQCSGADEDD